MRIGKAKLKNTEELSKLIREKDVYENILDKRVVIPSIKDIKNDIGL